MGILSHPLSPSTSDRAFVRNRHPRGKELYVQSAMNLLGVTSWLSEFLGATFFFFAWRLKTGRSSSRHGVADSICHTLSLFHIQKRTVSSQYIDTLVAFESVILVNFCLISPNILSPLNVFVVSLFTITQFTLFFQFILCACVNRLNNNMLFAFSFHLLYMCVYYHPLTVFKLLLVC